MGDEYSSFCRISMLKAVAKKSDIVSIMTYYSSFGQIWFW